MTSTTTQSQINDQGTIDPEVLPTPLSELFSTPARGGDGTPPPSMSHDSASSKSFPATRSRTKKTFFDVTADDSIANSKRISFPCKVYQMLEDAHDAGLTDVISWNSTGTGFTVHDVDRLTSDIIPRYFQQTKYKSFQRQLTMYGFHRVVMGQHKGLRSHPCFTRDNVREIRWMKPDSRSSSSKSSSSSSVLPPWLCDDVGASNVHGQAPVPAHLFYHDMTHKAAMGTVAAAMPSIVPGSVFLAQGGGKVEGGMQSGNVYESLAMSPSSSLPTSSSSFLVHPDTAVRGNENRIPCVASTASMITQDTTPSFLPQSLASPPSVDVSLAPSSAVSLPTDKNDDTCNQKYEEDDIDVGFMSYFLDDSVPSEETTMNSFHFGLGEQSGDFPISQPVLDALQVSPSGTMENSMDKEDKSDDVAVSQQVLDPMQVGPSETMDTSTAANFNDFAVSQPVLGATQLDPSRTMDTATVTDSDDFAVSRPVLDALKRLHQRRQIGR